MSKDVVAGLGEIGMPILHLISKKHLCVGYDIDPKKMNLQKFKRLADQETRFLHVCIPFDNNFVQNVVNLFKKFKPKGIVIHSTISPYTTKTLQKKLPIPVIYSATRGVHKRMLYDLKRYTKFFAIEKDAPKKDWAKRNFSRLMKECGVKTKAMSEPIALELAKIVVDTSYYGWLINYAQISNMIAKKHGVNYDEMWSFSDEIHKFLGNRPKLFPGYIGGHCLDGNEIIFIKTNNGMRPITIKEYVECDYCNDVLSYDPKEGKPFFDKVISKWEREYCGEMITIDAGNSSITTTDEHIMLVSTSLSERFAKDVQKGDYVPLVAALPNRDIKLSVGNSSIPITPELCRFFGYCMSKGVKKHGIMILPFDQDKSNVDVVSILKKMGVHYHIVYENNVYMLHSKDLLNLYEVICGNNTIPEFIYFVSRQMKEEFLKGCGGVISPTVHAGIQILLLSLGYLGSGIKTDIGNGGSVLKGSQLQILNSYQNLHMVQVTKTIHRRKVQKVYSIDTANHLFFSTGGILIHNCVIPNLKLIDEEQLWQIDKINNLYTKNVKEAKSIAKRYVKGKQSYTSE